MAYWLERDMIRTHLHLNSKVALILIAVCSVVQESSELDLALPQGYLSIDCGNTRANYTDSKQLEWVGDYGTYIKTGKSSEQLFVESSIGDNRALRSYRFFPESRNKYCYELPITDTIELSYLFRASFYMNESVLKAARPFEFTVSIDGSDWFTLKSGNDSETSLLIVQEGIFYLTYGAAFFCLRPIVGVPFISSLEMRSFLKNSMYVYPSWTTQYLALISRSNVGASSTAPDVRYPDDFYDRIWKTPDASEWADVLPTIATPEDLSKQDNSEKNFVPSKVMQDAWLLQPHDASPGTEILFGVYKNGPQLQFNPPGQYLFVIVYAEDLNRTASKYQNSMQLQISSFSSDTSTSADTDTVYDSPIFENFSSSGITMFQAPFFFPGSDFINISLKLCSSPLTADTSKPCGEGDGRLPSINAVEIYGQYNYNFSRTNQVDDQIVTVLKTIFSLTDWQGDPCVPVSHDWLSCTLSLLERFPTYYVTSINLSNRGISSVTYNNVTATPNIWLNSLNELSITQSRLDDPTFQLLMNYSSPVLSILNLSHNALTTLPTTWENTIESLVVLDLSYNQLKGQVSSLDTLVQRNSWSIKELYINDNELGGTFPSSLYFSSLPNLTIANFDQNSIDGTLDLSAWYSALQKVSVNVAKEKANIAGAKLQMFSFVNNNITNIIPSVETFGSTVQHLLFQDKDHGILLGGNPYCKDAKLYIHRYLCRSNVTEDIIEDSNSNHKALIIATSTGAMVVLLLCCVFFLTIWRLWKQVLTLSEIQKALADRKVQPPIYQYSDLKAATRDFHDDNKLGSGGFGVVYKGFLADQTSVAVKKLFDSQSMQVLDDFLNEVMLITGIKHRNLVQLQGCCINYKQRMLIYEYAENGNLAEALWGSKAHESLSLEMRLGICLGVARGLSYLHEELQPSIIHRDVKPQNILLDKDFKPKIADFGLARHFSGETSEVERYTQISKVAGTRGYLAPEYALHGQLSSKADVYSYGILVLEVICGRKAVDLSLPRFEERVLKDWVRSKRIDGSLYDLLNTEFRIDGAEAEVIRAISIGLLCTQYFPERRPSMSQVVAMFLGRMEVEVLDEFDQVPFDVKGGASAFNPPVGFPSLESVEEVSAVFPLLSSPCSMATQVVELSVGR